MSGHAYDSFQFGLATGAVNLQSDALAVMLVTSAYVPDFAKHSTRADVIGEVVGQGYSDGGKMITGRSIDRSVPDRVTLRADNVVWHSATIRVHGAIVYRSSGYSPGHDDLITYVGFGRDIDSTAAPFTLTWNDDGVLYFERVN